MIKKLYAKEKVKFQEKKQTVVTKGLSAPPTRVKGQRVRIVDPRMKKELWAQKWADKEKKKGFLGKWKRR